MSEPLTDERLNEIEAALESAPTGFVAGRLDVSVTARELLAEVRRLRSLVRPGDAAELRRLLEAKDVTGMWLQGLVDRLSQVHGEP